MKKLFILMKPNFSEVGNNARKFEFFPTVFVQLIKIAADMVAHPLTETFTQSIYSGIYPNEWKEARMSPLYKSGAKNYLSNYRPISIIPTVSTFYEYLNANNLMTHCKPGLVSFHSTLTALFEATNNWSVNIDNGLLNGIVIIDLKKAFDTTDHEISLLELKNDGFDTAILKRLNCILQIEDKKAK